MTRARDCGEKVQYKTRTAAEDAVWHMKRTTLATGLTAYRCKYCDFWHFGHTRHRRR